MSVDYPKIVDLFNAEFNDSELTLLAESPDEPIYLPRDLEHPLDRILYTQGSYTSVLHEISHWCIAGKERRKQIDYGYWYKPYEQSAEEACLYKQFEAKTHAIEWIFSVAADVRFHIIPNNLAEGFEVSQDLKEKVYTAVLFYLRQGLPQRAEKFKQRLLTFYAREAYFKAFNESLFSLELLV